MSGSGAAERLARVIETQRELAAAGGDIERVMRLIAARCQDLTGADGAMVSLLQGNDMLLTTAATGSAAEVLGAIRPLATSVAKHAIVDGRPLLIEDCETDPRINRELQRMVGDTSLICVPLFNGSRVIGALNVVSRSETERLTEADRETMEMLSVVLSAAMSHAGEFEAVSRFRALFEGASFGIMVLGPDGRATEANPAIAQMLGRTRAELAATGFREYTHPDDVERSAALFDELMSGRSESHQAELRYCHSGGEVLWAQHTAALERDPEGRPVFVVAMIEDITQRKRTEEELLRQSELSRQQARHDALTGLPNRMRFAECVDQAIRSARRRKERIAVLMHGGDMETLSQNADIAMYAAKLANRPYAFYDPVEDRRDPPQHTLMAELRQAIADRELELFYQPIAALATGEVDAVEALLRWHHPTRGWIHPDSFIHIARETEVIKPLTLYVLEEALRQAQAWRAEGTELTIAVNVATRNLLDVEFPGQVAVLLDRSQVEASRLRLELTESTIFANPFRTKLVVGELAALGVGLSIDDFGTGYSSVAYLTRLPLSELKIERSFVLRMLRNPEDATIVRSIIHLGRSLGVAVVAEGVEDAPTWQRLKELGCTAAQGNHLSRPVPAGELRDWLLDKRRTGLEPATSSLGSSRSTS